MRRSGLPKKQGLYDPQFEHDSCGVGFVCNIKGMASNDIVRKGIEVLDRLSHRGAVGADPETGDGAGILIQIPHDFFKKECTKIGLDLPEKGEYGTGLVFMPTSKRDRTSCEDIFAKVIKGERQELIGWRDVPVDETRIGVSARKTQPVMRQVFIKKQKGLKDQISFERKLYIIRKQVEKKVRSLRIKQGSFFYITNLSSRTFSYKGLLMPHQLEEFFLDLKDRDIRSALCMVHSRYSTNTFPTWDLAQPFRFLAHNGEINTLRGNINWMRAKESQLESELFGKDIKKIKPVIVPGGSDSATIDNVFELLVLSGRSLAHAMMMLIPAAWENNSQMPENLRDFHEFHSCFMEPWDGPAAMAFTDGTRIGALLDRNGLRPARYIVTKDDMVVMASEVGVLDIDPANIRLSGRLEPGKILFINTDRQMIISDKDVKDIVSAKKPYKRWLKEEMIDLASLPLPVIASEAKQSRKSSKIASSFASLTPRNDDLITLQKAFGYTREDLKAIMKPMAETAKEPIGSMGNDTPHAVLSNRPQLLYNYFKQLFAQVTNPAIDFIREEIVMSLESFIGPQRNVLSESREHAHKLRVKRPVLTDEDLKRLRGITVNGFRTKTIKTLFTVGKKRSLKRSLDRLCRDAVSAIKEGYSFIILSDRGLSRTQAAIPMLLALGAVHHCLIDKSLRTQIGIIIESGEPREVHHFALLFGYGADCVNPYLAYETLKDMIRGKELSVNFKQALSNYRSAVDKGILKILSKMGISTLQSYRAAQIFEALGLNESVIKRAFSGTTSRIGGVGLDEIEKETLLRHGLAYPRRENALSDLEAGGVYQWKRDGEFHLWNPETISTLQDACRSNDYAKYKVFSGLIDDQSDNPTTLRSLLRFKKTRGIPIEEVEPVEEILKRFATGAMSFGSISSQAHETLALAMNRIGGRSNTGEGGEDPTRFIPLSDGDSRRSSIKQVASGRFGVTTNYLVNADELQIKIAQGAKPGEGGQLPGHKVSEIIARTRYTTPGVTLISPPPHHDIYSIEDLAQLIFDLKNANPRARISVKLVSEAGVGTVAAGVAKGHADMILISGGDGGTGASPKSSIRHAGLPWELGLAETHQTLVLNGLRTRTRLQTDGQMRTGRDVAIAAMLGAEEYGFCTAALIVMGCVMLRHCHLNNCSVGVATQDAMLERRFRGKVEEVVNYFNFVAHDLREIMAALGVKSVNELVGRTDLLKLDKSVIPWKAKRIDYSKILYRPEAMEGERAYKTIPQDHGVYNILDLKLIELSKKVLGGEAEQVNAGLHIRNNNRTTGAMLSGVICKARGESGLPVDTIRCRFKGVAGQSFGAFLAKGVTFELEGLANDYVGKGISGGKIIVYPDKSSDYDPKENIIIGNTTFYGAITGEAYIRGAAGERFCIRNSGLHAVVEGVGDHGCEYMTGGIVVVLGSTGRNFAAGMSGGIAYVYDEDGTFKNRCNMAMVELERLNAKDEAVIHSLLFNHYKFTKSEAAKTAIDNLGATVQKFVKVMPMEYKRILEGRGLEEKLDLAEASDG